MCNRGRYDVARGRGLRWAISREKVSAKERRCALFEQDSCFPWTGDVRSVHPAHSGTPKIENLTVGERTRRPGEHFREAHERADPAVRHLGMRRQCEPLIGRPVLVRAGGVWLFTYAAADAPLADAAPRFVDKEFGPEDDVNRFAILAHASRPVATLDQATNGRRMSSPRFREVIAPLGLGDELRVALRAGTTTWGFLCLHREGTTGFSSSEISTLQHLASHGGEAIRRIVAEAMTDTPEPHGPAGVVIAARDRALAVTDSARAWLEDLEGLVLRVGDPLPLQFQAIVARLEAVERGSVASTLPAIRLVNRRGVLLEVHAARLRSDGEDTSVAITIAPAAVTARSGLRLGPANAEVGRS